MVYSASDYILYNDFEGAVERYHNANFRWQSHWWECVVTIYNNCADWSKKYILDPVKRTITKVCETVEKAVNRRRTIRKDDATILWGDIEIAFLNGTADKDNPHGEKTYFFKFYEDVNRPPVFDKIGTTTRSYLKRLKDEIRYYNKAGFDIERVEVCEVIDCGDTPAEAYESILRAKLIKMFPGTWHKNDRFFGTDIPVDIFNKICADFAAA